MNRQPYSTPPRIWEPKLTRWWVRLSRGYRWRQLRRKQDITRVEVQGGDWLKSAVAAGQGVLIAPNHSAHYDSAALYIAADQLDVPLYFMTAWQVFSMSSRFECWAMQRLGCFSVDREAVDRQAFKQAMQVLLEEPFPLVIFPEGDIYHISDRVTAFREGAASIAITAARKEQRPVVVVPCGIKFWYEDDPTEHLKTALSELEDRVLLRPQPERPLYERIHRLAEAALALKELDYLGHTRSGQLRQRVGNLAEAVLANLEERHGLRREGQAGKVPERVKLVRQAIIRKFGGSNGQPVELPIAERRQLEQEMDDLFFVMQLYSYPGDYVVERPTIERIAETLDKFEEDILRFDLPRVRGRRRVIVRFGEPMPISGERGRDESARLTTAMQQRVQMLIDEINAAESKDVS